MRPDLHLVRRVITRPEEAGGEPFEGVDAAEFARRAARGEFALHWCAHGLRYGIPAGVRDSLSAGHDAVFNTSRAMLEEAARAFPGLRVIHVTARPETLAARLSARGRETPDDIARRLARAPVPIPGCLAVDEIDNSGLLEDAVAAFLAVLKPVRA